MSEHPQSQTGGQGARREPERESRDDKRTGADPTTAPPTDSPSEDFYSGENRTD